MILQIRRIALCAVIAAILIACAKPHVVQAVKTDDLNLNCSQLKIEIDKANAFRMSAEKEKGVTGTNVMAFLFFAPGLQATDSNVNQAVAAANTRAAHLSNLYVSKKCDTSKERVQASAAVTPSLIYPASPVTASTISQTSTDPAIDPLFNIEALPLKSERAKNVYRDWLTRSKPRAFAIGSNGSWRGTWGLKPSDKSLPTDPSERAIFLCEQTNGVSCKLYAVDDKVVWKP